jgi:hypothetical protein
MLAKRLKRVEKNLIGLWRFRERGKPRLWCATFEVGGYYYDTTGKRTLDQALDAVFKEVTKLKRSETKARRGT